MNNLVVIAQLIVAVSIVIVWVFRFKVNNPWHKRLPSLLLLLLCLFVAAISLDSVY